MMRVLFALTLLFSAAIAKADSSTHTGIASFYDYDGGGGNCSLPVPDHILTAAMNATDYANSAACGGVIEVTNTDTGASIRVRIDDQCPECEPGKVDLDQDAFAQIADLDTGLIPISWRYVANDQAGDIKLYFDGSSSQWWAAVQVRDHLYPLARLEYRLSGSDDDYTDIPRESYNYFVAPNGLGIGPYDFRITDFWEQSVEVDGVSLLPATEIDTGIQFELYGEDNTADDNDTNTDDSSASSSGGSGGGSIAWPVLLLLGGLLALRLPRNQPQR